VVKFPGVLGVLAVKNFSSPLQFPEFLAGDDFLLFRLENEPEESHHRDVQFVHSWYSNRQDVKNEDLIRVNSRDLSRRSPTPKAWNEGGFAGKISFSI